MLSLQVNENVVSKADDFEILILQLNFVKGRRLHESMSGNVNSGCDGELDKASEGIWNQWPLKGF